MSDAFFFDTARQRRRPGRSLASRLMSWLVAALALLAAGLLVFHLWYALYIDRSLTLDHTLTPDELRDAMIE